MSENPTDIRSVIQNSQDVIDAAVEVISATRRTQNILEQNIYVTDQKIGVHNVDPESHDDIRQQLNAMFDDPVISGVSAVASGEANTWSLYSAPKFDGMSVSKFVIRLPDGTSEEVTAENNSATWTHTFTVAHSSETYFTVQAYGGSFSSKITQKNLMVTKYLPPDMSSMVHTIPSTINRSTTYTYQINGIVDPDSDLSSITVACNTVGVTMGNEGVCEQNTDLTFTVGDIQGPSTVSFTFTARDSRGLTSSATVNVHLNAYPDVSQAVVTADPHLPAGVSRSMYVTGITDADGQAVNLTLSVSAPNVVITPSSGLYLGDTFTVTPSSSYQPGDTVTFTFTVSDPNGGVATFSRTYEISSPPDLTNFEVTTHSYPHIGTNNITLTGAVDPDNDGDCTYSISCSNGAITFSKTAGIVDDEVITYTVPNTVARGTVLTFTVTVYDVTGDSITTTFTTTVKNEINVLDVFDASAISVVVPDMNNVRRTDPVSRTSRTYTGSAIRIGNSLIESGTYVVPPSFATFANESGKVANMRSCPTIEFTNKVSSIQGYDFTVTVVAADASGVIQATGAKAFSVIPPSILTKARGTTWTVSVTVSDGFDSTTQVYTFQQAQLCEVTLVSAGYKNPSYAFYTDGSLRGGYEHAMTFEVSAIDDPDGLFVKNASNPGANEHFCFACLPGLVLASSPSALTYSIDGHASTDNISVSAKLMESTFCGVSGVYANINGTSNKVTPITLGTVEKDSTDLTGSAVVLTEGSSIDIYAPKVAVQTPMDIVIDTYNYFGELCFDNDTTSGYNLEDTDILEAVSVPGTSFSLNIEPTEIAANPDMTTPETNDIVEYYEGFDIEWPAISTMVDTSTFVINPYYELLNNAESNAS